jgi:hypothetical protein
MMLIRRLSAQKATTVGRLKALHVFFASVVNAVSHVFPPVKSLPPILVTPSLAPFRSISSIGFVRASEFSTAPTARILDPSGPLALRATLVDGGTEPMLVGDPASAPTPAPA